MRNRNIFMARKNAHGTLPTRLLKPLREHKEHRNPERALRRRTPMGHRYQRYVSIRTKGGPAPIVSYADLWRSMGLGEHGV